MLSFVTVLKSGSCLARCYLTNENHLKGVAELDPRARDLSGHSLAAHSHFGVLPGEIRALVSLSSDKLSFVEVCSKCSHWFTFWKITIRTD